MRNCLVWGSCWIASEEEVPTGTDMWTLRGAPGSPSLQQTSILPPSPCHTDTQTHRHTHTHTHTHTLTYTHTPRPAPSIINTPQCRQGSGLGQAFVHSVIPCPEVFSVARRVQRDAAGGGGGCRAIWQSARALKNDPGFLAFLPELLVSPHQ